MTDDVACTDPSRRSPLPARSRRRAAMILTVAAVVVLALVVGLVAVLLPSSPTPAPVPGPPPAAPDAGGDGWDLAAQTELATRPMPSLPEGAALPQPLSADSAGPPIRLPSPNSRDGLVPRGFPPTAEGALAQLAALTAAGLVNADPGAYAAAYTAVAAPGAPAVEATPLHRGLVEIRARSGPAHDRRGTRADLQLDPGRRTDQGQHRPRPLRGGLRDRPARQRRQRADPVHRGRGLPGAAVRRRPVVDQPRRGGRARAAGLARQRRGRAGRLPGGDRCCVTPSPTS